MKLAIFSHFLFLFSVSFQFGEITINSSSRGVLNYKHERLFFIGDDWHFQVSMDSENHIFLLSSKSIHQLDLNNMISREEFDVILFSNPMRPSIEQVNYSFGEDDDDFLNVLIPIWLSVENQIFDGRISIIDFGFGVLQTKIYASKLNESEPLFFSLLINNKSVDSEDLALENILELVGERRKRHHDLFYSNPLEESTLDPFQTFPPTP